MGVVAAVLIAGAAAWFAAGRKSAAPPVVEHASLAVSTSQTPTLNEQPVRATPPAATASSKPTEVALIAPAHDITPLPLGPEFAPLLEADPGVRQLHEAIEREPREEPWATLMESKWHTAFGENPELLAYGTPNVHCRKTRCEIQLITFRRTSLDRAGWMQLIAKGAGRQVEGSVPLVRRVLNGVLGFIENDGATVILYSYEYERDPATP